MSMRALEPRRWRRLRLRLRLRSDACLTSASALALLAPTGAATHRDPPPAATGARAARHTIQVRDSGALRYRSVAASSIVDEGSIAGTIPGRATVTFRYDGSPRVSAHFTIRARAGTIAGEANCVLHNPTSLTPSFHGALRITGGSGRFAHAHGSGHLYGVFHRRGYAIDMQAVGALAY